MLSVAKYGFKLNVIMVNVVMLSVVAPQLVYSCVKVSSIRNAQYAKCYCTPLSGIFGILTLFTLSQRQLELSPLT